MRKLKKLINLIKSFFSNRYLVIIFITVIISICFVIRLFNLQIVNGEEYREKSQKRLLRTETISATRGDIVDRNGVILATNKLSYNVLLYKVNVETEVLNNSLATLIQILDSNNDTIYSSLPLNDEHTELYFSSDEKKANWLSKYKLEQDSSFDEVIEYFTNKYKLEKYTNDKDLLIKLIMIRYEAVQNGFSLSKSATISYDISSKSLAQIEEKKSELYGISVVSSSKRYYPTGELTSHIIGYVSKITDTQYSEKKDQGYNLNSVIGIAGIEASFEEYLKGTDGTRKIETDSLGNVTSETDTKEAKQGDTVTLTIDYRLQKVAQEALISTINGLNNGTISGNPVQDANAGTVVVLDCKTGETLAMVNYPSYDNNLFVGGISNSDWEKISENALNPMYNRAISGLYSPGSTYKMLVGLAGLMSGGITVDEMYYDPGVYPYGYHPKCWIYSYYGITHGYINVSGAIKGSCNCFFYEVGRRIGISKIVEYAKEFGLGSKTGIELSQEAAGTIAGDTDKDWYLGDTLSAAIGQSYNQYTPIQMANYISTIANGGTLNKVTLIKDIKNNDDNTSILRNEIDNHAKEYTGVDFTSRTLDINEEYINAIKVGMLSVTSETGGTANLIFRNSNIQVAGKTGTSQVTSGSNNGIFVGFAPYDNPKIAVVAIIEHGEEGTYTANVVKPIMEEYFNISTEDKANEISQDASKSEISF